MPAWAWTDINTGVGTEAVAARMAPHGRNYFSACDTLAGAPATWSCPRSHRGCTMLVQLLASCDDHRFVLVCCPVAGMFCLPAASAALVHLLHRILHRRRCCWQPPQAQHPRTPWTTAQHRYTGMQHMACLLAPVSRKKFAAARTQLPRCCIRSLTIEVAGDNPRTETNMRWCKDHCHCWKLHAP